MLFDLVSPFQPAGDQPRAITELTAGLARGDRYQTLLGVTGSGKTMTIAHVVAQFGRPTLVLSHNKTLAAQLYGEFKSLFPKNAVEFFISYYDYYQPEAYVPQTDTYIAKDSSINDDIESLRLRATSSLMERDDVIVVASVSAIYGLGDPEAYRQRLVTLAVGEQRGRDALLGELVGVQYQRNDVAFERGTGRKIALLVRERDQVFEASDRDAPRGGLCRALGRRRRRAARARRGSHFEPRRGRGRRSGRGRRTILLRRFSLAQRTDRFIGRRQVRRIGDPDQHHFGGSDRLRRGLHLGNAAEQHLPGTRQYPHRQAGGESAAAHPLDLGERAVLRHGRDDLHPRHEMGELGEIREHDRGIGAGIVLVAELA